MEKKLVIPVEIKSRELDAAIVLSIQAIKKGWTVYLGQKQQIWPIIELMPDSIYFLKSIVPGEYKNLVKIKKYGNFITSLDIEGLNMGVEPIGVTRRYSNETIKLADKIFFWGKNDFSRVKSKFKNINKKYFISGSPVVDAWKIHLKKIKKINEDNSILISMNFMRGDPSIKHVKYDLEKHMMGSKINKKQIDYLKREYELKDLSFKDFYAITESLAKKFPKNKIIIRPHPEENIKRYKPLEKIHNNLKIDNKSSRIIQLKKCSVFIHFNSTMAVQAYFMKKKVIMYNPIKNKRALSILCPVPKLVSNHITSEKKLFKNVLKSSNKKFPISMLLENHDFDASEKIINQLEILIKKRKKIKNNNLSLFLVLLFFIKYRIKQLIFYFIGVISIFIPSLRNKFWRGRFYFHFKNLKWKELDEISLRNLLKFYNCRNQKKLKIKRFVTGMYEIKYDR